MKLGCRIKMLLDLHYKVPQDLATYCKVSHTAAHNWINGAEPRPVKKQAIAAFFNVTVQDLEYAPILSLSPILRTSNSGVRTTLDRIMSEQTADMLIFQELNTCAPKSNEYRLGMRDYVVARLSGTELPTRFQSGSVQSDAYNAGTSHAEIFMNLAQIPI